MRKLLHTLVALCALSTSAVADESSNFDSEGYIHDWIMLAPIALPDQGAAGDLLLKDQIPNEASIQPKAGEIVKIQEKELEWTRISTSKNYFDFNEILKSLNDRSVGYMVTYVECENDIPKVMISVGSNDQGRIYFNGTDIYAYTDARQLEIDGDKGKITLKKGLNVLVFKIINEQNSWQGSMRLTDMSEKPLKGVKVKLAPLGQ